MTKSEVIIGLFPPTFVCATAASLVCAYEFSRLKYWPFLPSVQNPALPFELTANALGLLLVFRTNASYSRWAESREYLSKASALCADAARVAVVWFNLEDEPLLRDFLKWDKVFFKALQV